MLDPETSVPSVPRPYDFTFTFPPPRLADTSIADLAHETVEEQQSSFQVKEPTLSKRCIRPASTPLLPSVPTTPPTKARVKLPCTFPISVQPSPGSATDLPKTDYFDGIKIPSPLLYHRRSREQLLTRSSDMDNGTEVNNGFLLTCGRDPPSPDFQSYKVFDDTPSQLRLDEPQASSVISGINDILQQQPTQTPTLNIPHPPWIVQLQNMFKTPQVFLPRPPPITLGGLPTPPIITTTNTFSIAQLGIPCEGAQVPQLQLEPSTSQPLVMNDYDLVFPKLSRPPACIIAETQRPSSRKDSNAHFINDNAEEVARRWQAFEDIVKNPKRRICSSQDTVITYPSKTCHLPWHQLPDPQPWFDFTACPTNKCLALVSAGLYQHQLLSWPQQPMNVRSLGERATPPMPLAAVHDPDADKVAKMADWLNDLGLEAEHIKDCPVGARSGTSSGYGLDQMFSEQSSTPAPKSPGLDVLAEDPSHASSPDSAVLVYTSPALSSTPSRSLDEGYFTGESLVDLTADDAVMSEDEWAAWDWD